MELLDHIFSLQNSLSPTVALNPRAHIVIL